MLAKRYQTSGDAEALNRLVSSHLRLVAKIAMGYRGYGLPLGELIGEGNLGMMQALKRFDPDKGFRLATYAMWWIKAAMQEYILHSWSLVKIGTTAAQKKLFFNLRRMKNKMSALGDGDLPAEAVTEISVKLSVSKEEVVNMNRRISGPDHSLNAQIRSDSDGEWQDWLVDDRDDQETELSARQESGTRHRLLNDGLATLNEREKLILSERRLKDDPATLEELSQRFGISRERVRQIEVRAFDKLRKSIHGAGSHLNG